MDEITVEKLLKEWFDAVAAQAPSPPTLAELRERATPWWKKAAFKLNFDAALLQVAAAEGFGMDLGLQVPIGDAGIPALLLDEDASKQAKTTARIVMCEFDGERLRLRLALGQPLLGAKSAQLTFLDEEMNIRLDVFAEMQVANEIVVDQDITGNEAKFAQELNSRTGSPFCLLIKVDQPGDWSTGSGKERLLMGVRYESRIRRVFAAVASGVCNMGQGGQTSGPGAIRRLPRPLLDGVVQRGQIGGRHSRTEGGNRV